MSNLTLYCTHTMQQAQEEKKCLRPESPTKADSEATGLRRRTKTP